MQSRGMELGLVMDVLGAVLVVSLRSAALQAAS